RHGPTDRLRCGRPRRRAARSRLRPAHARGPAALSGQARARNPSASPGWWWAAFYPPHGKSTFAIFHHAAGVTGDAGASADRRARIVVERELVMHHDGRGLALTTESDEAAQLLDRPPPNISTTASRRWRH